MAKNKLAVISVTAIAVALIWLVLLLIIIKLILENIFVIVAAIAGYIISIILDKYFKVRLARHKEEQGLG
jgi:hypothetical protein